MTRNWKKLTAEKKNIKFFWSKTTIYLALGLHIKNVQVTEEAFSSQKRPSNTSKHELLKFFYYFCGSFLPSWMRIHWPDWIRIRNPAYDEEVAGRVGQAGAQPRVLSQETLVRRVRHRFPAHRSLQPAVVFFSVADPGCLSRILDTNFSHPGSRIRIISIPVRGSASKNLNILTPKNGFYALRNMIWVVHPGSGSPDQDTDFTHPGSGSATLIFLSIFKKMRLES